MCVHLAFLHLPTGTLTTKGKLSCKCSITTTDLHIHIYGETNGDRVFVRNPAKGKLAHKCTTASTDCHIQIHVQQTSPYTYDVTCPNIIILIYNHYRLLSHGTPSMTPLPPPCTIITVQVAICACSICASATRNKTTSASCQG